MSADSGEGGAIEERRDGSLAAAGALAIVALLYWYLLVFGAAAASSGLPVPDFVPLVPGWPPSEADLVPVAEDSAHFFYLSDLLSALGGRRGGAAATAGGPPPPTVRFAVFNVAEAWVFSFLPALLADRRRLPLPAVLGAWLGALGLTNAFLAPYLAFRELLASRSSEDDGSGGDESSSGVAAEEGNEATGGGGGGGGWNRVLRGTFGAVAAAVAAYAAASSLGAPPEQWGEFRDLAAADRTYLAFCVDLVLFGIFQPFVLRRVSSGNKGRGEEDVEMRAVYNVPFVGLLAWLFGL